MASLCGCVSTLSEMHRPLLHILQPQRIHTCCSSSCNAYTCCYYVSVLPWGSLDRWGTQRLTGTLFSCAHIHIPQMIHNPYRLQCTERITKAIHAAVAQRKARNIRYIRESTRCAPPQPVMIATCCHRYCLAASVCVQCIKRTRAGLFAERRKI
jgi:hypothetical protein